MTQLLNQGADVNSQDTRQGELFRMLWGLQPSGQRAGTRLHVGGTPLMIATEQKDRDMIDLLLKQGADVNQQDSYSQTALYYALGVNSPSSRIPVSSLKVARTLLDHGADPNTGKPTTPTLLFQCIQSGRSAEVDLLLSHHVDPSRRNYDGSTPLHNAAFHEEVKIAAALLKHGAAPNARDNNGDTPLHTAVLWARGPAASAMVGLLLEHGALRDLKDNTGLTPLQCARNAKQTALITLLQKKAVAAK